MLFWIVAGGLTLIVAGALLLALWREGQALPADRQDMQVYRDQLAEVDRDLERGVIDDAEAKQIRVEVSRRLLEADRVATVSGGAGQVPRAASLAATGLIAMAVAGGGLGLYVWLGAQGYPDLPLAKRIAAAEAARVERPSQELAEAEASLRLPPSPEIAPAFLQLLEKLRQVVTERPDDLQGQRLLAQNEARVGNFVAARVAQDQVVALQGDAATATEFSDLADLMILAAGGYVSPEAEVALTQALRRDPRNGPARYYSGLMFAQTGRPDLAFRLWRSLLDESVPQAPWVRPVRAQIEEIAMLAGVRYELPPLADAQAPARGPSAADVEAASEMSAEDRDEMIRGMVDGLAERLANEGGPAEDWARLIGALGVLGETEDAAAIWTEAQSVFADNGAALAKVRAAAERAGVAE